MCVSTMSAAYYYINLFLRQAWCFIVLLKFTTNSVVCMCPHCARSQIYDRAVFYFIIINNYKFNINELTSSEQQKKSHQAIHLVLII